MHPAPLVQWHPTFVRLTNRLVLPKMATTEATEAWGNPRAVSRPPKRQRRRCTKANPRVGPTLKKEVRVLEIQTLPAQPALRTSSCSICGCTVRVNPLKTVDTDVICKKCRCKRCSIPMSDKLCKRCGIAHGTPSAEPGLCEQCFTRNAGDAAIDIDEIDSRPTWQAIA